MMLLIVMLYGLSYVHIISVSAFPIRYTHNIIQRLEQQQQNLKAEKNDVDVSKNECRIENVLMSFITAATLCTSPIIASATSGAVTDLGLKPPTDEKPQIMWQPTTQQQTKSAINSNNNNAREPILQGLVYFPERAPSDPTAKVPTGQQEKQKLDYYSDILVLTATAATQPDIILAGAKFPVSTVRFPFSFEMYNENLLLSRSDVKKVWDRVVKTEDVILRANICESDASEFPCTEQESKKSAEGVAKLITNLPGLAEGQTLRAPASLPLQ